MIDLLLIAVIFGVYAAVSVLAVVVWVALLALGRWMARGTPDPGVPPDDDPEFLLYAAREGRQP